METIQKYFTKLTEKQLGQLAALRELYTDWNSKINVISRKDIDNLYLHHVLHSMAIAKAIRFRPGTKVLDFGTGGGFPGIPLAILFPETEFKLIDGTGKKILVASEVAKAIGLENCRPDQDCPQKYLQEITECTAQRFYHPQGRKHRRRDPALYTYRRGHSSHADV